MLNHVVGKGGPKKGQTASFPCIINIIFHALHKFTNFILLSDKVRLKRGYVFRNGNLQISFENMIF